MRLVLRQVVVDDLQLRRVIEIVLDLLGFRDLGQLRDVECAVLESQTVRPIEALIEDLNLALAILFDDGVDLVLEAAADEDRALIALPQ